MPHKRNPIASENMAGCARIMRGYMVAAYEDIALWHERDISHSSAERILSSDATCLLDYMLTRYTKVIKNLVVFEDRMKQNIYMTQGVIFAQRVMTMLIDQYGYSREDAYDLVQPLAMNAWHTQTSFYDQLVETFTNHPTVTLDAIQTCFSLDFHLAQVDAIYKRIKGLHDDEN